MRFVNEYILLPVLPVFIIACGIFFFVKLGFFKPKKLVRVLKMPFKREKSDGISPFSALTVSLAGTLGVGNIAGVATAIALGGEGAVVWMWLSAVCCLGLKYAETYLAVEYRVRKGKNYVGGPMYYMKKCFKSPVPAVVFSCLCLASSLVSTPTVQVRSAAVALKNAYGVQYAVTATTFAVLCFVIVKKGIGSISRFTEKMIPAVTGIFFLMSLGAVLSQYNEIPATVANALAKAFDFKAAAAGACGHTVASAMKHGAVKGVLSHEAGAGSASISHACADTACPSRQGAIGMLEVTVDTLIMCTLTALVILLSGVDADTYDGVLVTSAAYSVFYPVIGEHFITFATVFFAFATVVCQSYYGAVCLNYLFDSRRAEKAYLYVYCACVFCGALISSRSAWELSDLFTCLLTLFNTTCLVILSKKVKVQDVIL